MKKNAPLDNLASMKYFKVPLHQQVSAIGLECDKRVYDFHLADRVQSSVQNYTIDVDPALKIAKLPPNQSFKNKYFTYSLTSTQKGNKIMVERKVKVLEYVVKAEEFNALKALLLQLVKVDEYLLLFQ